MAGGDIARPSTFILGRDGRVAWYDLTENWRVRPRPSVLLEELGPAALRPFGRGSSPPQTIL